MKYGCLILVIGFAMESHLLNPEILKETNATVVKDADQSKDSLEDQIKNSETTVVDTVNGFTKKTEDYDRMKQMDEDKKKMDENMKQMKDNMKRMAEDMKKKADDMKDKANDMKDKANNMKEKANEMKQKAKDMKQKAGGVKQDDQPFFMWKFPGFSGFSMSISASLPTIKSTGE